MITNAMIMNPTFAYVNNKSLLTENKNQNIYNYLTIIMTTTGVMKAQMKCVSYRNQHLMMVR